MRLLVIHADHFGYTITEPARSRLREAVAQPAFQVDEVLVALVTVERADEGQPLDVAARAVDELLALAHQVGARRMVLHPFAHLFGDPSAPAIAIEVLDAMAAALRAAGLEVHRSPFGWFTRWDLQAKGHPLSRVARTVHAAGPPAEPGTARCS
jgi:threonyl-tRNA synthetase